MELALLQLGRQLTIPASGVFQSGTRQVAFVDRGGGYFEPREVETGVRAGDDLVVLKGLKAGEHIVTSANFCVWQLILAHFGSLIWPTPSADVLGRAGGAGLYIRNSGGSCGNVGTRRCCGFPRTVERVGSLGLAFHAFHGPAVPQLISGRTGFLLS